MIEYLSYPYEFPPRQELKVWKAYNHCSLLAHLKDFVYEALSAELPVGDPLASWKPHEIPVIWTD